MLLLLQTGLRRRWSLLMMLLLLLLLSECTRLCHMHSTTVEHDFHIVHNVDNRSPEIDPFWYVGRGVRPIGRFGKRHSVEEDMQPVLRTLLLLLNNLKSRRQMDQVPMDTEQDWLP